MSLRRGERTQASHDDQKCRHVERASNLLSLRGGETAIIRSGELFTIIRQRENDAIQHAISKLQQIAGVGIEQAEVTARKESAFPPGADTVFIEKEVIKKSGLTDTDILADFISGSLQASPEAYIEQAAHESVRWLPIFFFMTEGGLSQEDTVNLLRTSKVAKPGTALHMRKRIMGRESAYKVYVGAGQRECIARLREGTIPQANTLAKARHLASCLIGLTELESFDPVFLRAVLSQIVADFERHRRDSAIGSSMRRSAGRVDELLYAGRYLEEAK